VIARGDLVGVLVWRPLGRPTILSFSSCPAVPSVLLSPGPAPFRGGWRRCDGGISNP